MKFFDVHLSRFINNQILLNKISQQFLATTKLFTWRNTPIVPCSERNQLAVYLGRRQFI